MENFVPLDLNADNVAKIYSDCQIIESTTRYYEISLEQEDFGFPKNSKPLYFDASLLNAHIPSIYYLFGQLKTAHEPTFFLDIKDVLKKYDGTFWSDKRVPLFYLLHLGIAAGVITPPEFKTKKFIFSDDLRETLSPKDPDFPEWWEYNKSKWEER